MLNIDINLTYFLAVMLIVYFLQFLVVVYICESQYTISLNNGNILNITDCTNSYAMLTSSLTDLLRGLMIFTLDNLFYVYIYIFIGIACYSIIYPTSGPGKTLSTIFKTLRQDLKDCSKEIWTSIKQGLSQVFSYMNVVKFMELTVIGTVIIFFPEITNFMVKMLVKIGKL